VALIVLVAMMLASVVLVRSVDTTAVIAGNLTFKQASVQAGDYGVEAAVAALPNIVTTSLETNRLGNSEDNTSYWYYATMRTTDQHGVPTTQEAGATGDAVPINWNAVPVAAQQAGNTVRVVIERLCRGPAPVVEVEVQCFFEGTAAGGSKAIGRPVFTAIDSVFFRVTAHVTGPRNTVSIVQAIVSR
jgi:type IV pilus assembly protein PilX